MHHPGKYCPTAQQAVVFLGHAVQNQCKSRGSVGSEGNQPAPKTNRTSRCFPSTIRPKELTTNMCLPYRTHLHLLIFCKKKQIGANPPACSNPMLQLRHQLLTTVFVDSVLRPRGLAREAKEMDPDPGEEPSSCDPGTRQSWESHDQGTINKHNNKHTNNQPKNAPPARNKDPT